MSRPRNHHILYLRIDQRFHSRQELSSPWAGVRKRTREKRNKCQNIFIVRPVVEWSGYFFSSLHPRMHPFAPHLSEVYPRSWTGLILHPLKNVSFDIGSDNTRTIYSSPKAINLGVRGRAPAISPFACLTESFFWVQNQKCPKNGVQFMTLPPRFFSPAEAMFSGRPTR